MRAMKRPESGTLISSKSSHAFTWDGMSCQYSTRYDAIS